MIKKSYVQKPAEVTRKWHVVDAKGRVLGQVATEVATMIIGRHKPTFTPHVDAGDFVIVINAREVAVTGNKVEKKKYFMYSGFPGGLRVQTFRDIITGKQPERIIRDAVYNMLPKNKLRTDRMNRLKVYAGAEHPHQSQVSKQ